MPHRLPSTPPSLPLRTLRGPLPFCLLVGCLLALALGRAFAGEEVDPEALTGLGEVYSPGGVSDPGGGDDSTFVDEASTLGLPMEPGEIDESLLAWPDDPISAAITPLKIDATSKRYFVFRNAVIPLIGVSADNACHLRLGNGSDICTFDELKDAYYTKVLADAAQEGLNKIRLWVDISGGAWKMKLNAAGKPVPDCVAGGKEEHPDNHPFKYYPNTAFPNKIGYWNLDEPNGTFFDNLKRVVTAAQNQAGGKVLIVEVTFFAPWVGEWELGPWHPNHGRLKTDLTHSVPVGFTDRSYFVKIDTAPATRAQNEAMREHQKNVIRWTVDALWNFDNVYFEIANEPENWNPGASCGYPTPKTAKLTEIVSWQNLMITTLKDYEQSKYVNTGLLANRHLIAVQPFSPEGAEAYINDPNVNIINGHYTTVDGRRGGLGAMRLVRKYANRPKALASNEDKISGLSCPSTDPICKAATANNGAPDSARSGAWEFMVNMGSAFDHFGYYFSSPNGDAVRKQLGALSSFMATLPLRQIATSPDPPQWVNLGAYVDEARAFRYWAALEPSTTATTRKYALYIHRSGTRKDSDGSELLFQGYQPRFGSYSDTLKLCFGAQAGPYFLLEWIKPSTNQRIGCQAVNWPGSTTCARGGAGSIQVSSPVYSYDIVLRATKFSQVPSCQ